MKKLIALIGFLIIFISGYSQTYVLRPRINAYLFNGQLPSYYLDTTSTSQDKNGQLTLNTLVTDSIYVLKRSMFDSTVSIGSWGYTGEHIILPESSSNTNAGLGVYSMVDYSATSGKVFAGTYSRMLAMTTNQANQSTMVGAETQFRLRDVDIADGVHAGLWAYAEQSGTSVLSGTGTFDAIHATIESEAGFTVGATEYLTGITVDASINASATINASANYSGIYIKSSGKDWFNGIKITGATNDIKLKNDATINNTSADLLTITEPTVAIIGEITALKTTEQLRLSYDASYYLTTTVLADGHTTFTTVDAVGAEADINFTPDGNVGIKTAAPGTALEVTGTTTTTAAIVSDLATANTEVVSPSATGLLTTLATDDIGDIAFTLSGGMTYVSTEGLMTIGTGGTFERLNEGAIAYTGSHLHDFTHSDGRLTYTGANTKHFTINISINIEGEESNQRVTLRLYKDGALITEIEDRHDFTAVDTDDSVGFTWLVEMATNEYVEVWGTSDVDADEFTVLGGSMVISQH